jgi:hypothetical protein
MPTQRIRLPEFKAGKIFPAITVGFSLLMDSFSSIIILAFRLLYLLFENKKRSITETHNTVGRDLSDLFFSPLF